LGPKGNAEFLVWLNQTQGPEGSGETGQLMESVLL